MAYYKDAPHQRRKVNHADQGSWDDEGTHYHHKPAGPVNRFGPELGKPCAATAPATARSSGMAGHSRPVEAVRSAPRPPAGITAAPRPGPSAVRLPATRGKNVPPPVQPR